MAVEQHDDAAGRSAPLRSAIEVLAWKVLSIPSADGRICHSRLHLALPEGIGSLDGHPVRWRAGVDDDKARHARAVAEKTGDVCCTQVADALHRDRTARAERMIVRKRDGAIT